MRWFLLGRGASFGWLVGGAGGGWGMKGVVCFDTLALYHRIVGCRLVGDKVVLLYIFVIYVAV